MYPLISCVPFFFFASVSFILAREKQEERRRRLRKLLAVQGPMKKSVHPITWASQIRPEVKLCVLSLLLHKKEFSCCTLSICWEGS